jgi:hypothetical protein
LLPSSSKYHALSQLQVEKIKIMWSNRIRYKKIIKQQK